MEIKICCEATVKIEDFNSAFNVDIKVLEFRKSNANLEGNILIDGEFIKDNLDEKFPFSEIIPFEIVFKNENFIVDEIKLLNLNYSEIVNLGMLVTFDIVVLYHIKEDVSKDEIILEEFIIDDDFTDKLDEYCVEDDCDDDHSLLEMLTDEEKAKINEKYDQLLSDLLSEREDNFFEESLEEEKEKTNVFISLSEENNRNITPLLQTIKEEYKVIKVIYINTDKDLERISKKENISLDKLYKDNKDHLNIDNRRLIIK